jgi:inosose dehydratase
MTIRWAYAINQWKPNIDDFVRRRDHERALKTISVSGFEAVELNVASFGPWEPLGNPFQIENNFGTISGFREFMESSALSGASSWFYDPGFGFVEDRSDGIDVRDPSALPELLAKTEWLASALIELGGDVLTVRAAPPAWQGGALTDEQLATVSAAWNAVGAVITEMGVRLSLHFDFLSSLRLDDGIARLIAATDPAFVGVTVDTAELAVSGIDVLSFITTHRDRIDHVQLKDANVECPIDEIGIPFADLQVRAGGGPRAIERWFFELGRGGLVDAEAVVSELVRGGYDGWVVVESDQSPHPPESAMLNGWYVQKVLSPLC